MRPEKPSGTDTNRTLVPTPFHAASLALSALLLLSTPPTAAQTAPAADAAQPAPAPAAAPRGEIAGTVTTPDGDPVAARVTIPSLRRVAQAGAGGGFRFESVPVGTYLVEAESPGFGEGVAEAEVPAGGVATVTIPLDLAVISDQVVVTAGPDARRQLEVAQPTTVLDGRELELRVEATLGQTLDEQPGVSSTYFGPGASRPVIRGLGGDRVRMLQDGLGTADASSTSPDHAVSAEPLAAERIEVLRGPATLLYGSSAVGGVVNVLEGRIPSHVPESISGVAEISAGSAADELSGGASADGGTGAWAWHADFATREGEDYEIPGGTLENSAVESDTVSFGTSWVGERGFVGVSVTGFDTLYGVPGEGEEGEEAAGIGGVGEAVAIGRAGGEGEEGPIRIDLEQRRLDLHGEILTPFAFLRGAKLRVGVADYEHRELEGDEVGTRFGNEAWEARFELVQKERGDLSGSFGLQASSSDFSAIGEEAFVPPSTTDRFALFAFEELELWGNGDGEAGGSATLQFGARFETQDVDPEARADGGVPPPRSFDGLSLSLGTVWQPEALADGWSVAASLARTERLPTANELYADGPHAATRTFEIGDPDLDVETSLGLDLSLRKSEGRLTGVFNLFWNRFDDFVFESFTGGVEDGLDVVRFAQRDARFFGAELDAVLHVAELDPGHLDLQLTADWVDGELTGDAGNLPRIPPLRIGAALHLHRARWRAQAEVRRVFEQDDVAAEETPTDGYTMVNASLSYRFIVDDDVVDLVLRATNLTDELARNHVSFLKEEAPLPGRDVSFVARYRF